MPGGTVTAVPWGDRFALFLADPAGGIYTAGGDPQRGFGPWASVSQGRSTPGATVTAVPWKDRFALFVADPAGGIYTAGGDPQRGFGPWASVSEGRSTPGATVTAVPWGDRFALFLADPAGGIYTAAGDPQRGFGPWASVSDRRTKPGGTVTAVRWKDHLAVFIADPGGGIFYTTGTPDAGWQPWASVPDGRTKPGATVTAVPWGDRLALFVADPSGGIFTHGSLKAFDFNIDFVGGTDPNGIPLNPQWTFVRAHPGGPLPSTASCHEFTKFVKDPKHPLQAERDPDLADCTNQTDLSMVDLPDGLRGTVCRAFSGPTIAGHVNWFPVTLEANQEFQGKIEFQGSNDNNIDNDYTAAYCCSGLGVNNNHSIHLEFNAFETVESFKTSGWVDVRNQVKTYYEVFFRFINILLDPANAAQVPAAQQAVANELAKVRRVFDGDTIVTGMFGLDFEHGPKSELHPVYAMATRRDDFENDPADESWLMFVRNVGNEGFCSSRLWVAPFESYTFHLPWREGMTSVEVIRGPKGTQFAGTPGMKEPFIGFVLPPDRRAGVFVQFTLGPAEQKPLIEGTLHLRWIGTPVTLPRAPVVVGETAVLSAKRLAKPLGADDAEARVHVSLARLTAAQRNAIAQEAARAAPVPALQLLPPAGPAQRLHVAPQAPAISLRPRGDAGPAVEEEQRERAAIRALCRSTSNAPEGLPIEICK